MRYYTILAQTGTCELTVSNYDRYGCTLAPVIILPYEITDDSKMHDNKDIHIFARIGGRSSLTHHEKDHHYFLNMFVCVGEFKKKRDSIRNKRTCIYIQSHTQ